MKNNFSLNFDYLDVLVHLLKSDYPNDIFGKIGKEFWSPLGTFEEIKSVADFIKMFKGIDFKVENLDFKNSWTNAASDDKYRLKFVINKEFFSLYDSNKIDAKYKKYKNWLKIKEIDNDFN
jgi:hypothetical protein